MGDRYCSIDILEGLADYAAVVVDNHFIEPFGVFGLHGEGGVAGFGAFKFAVFFFLDVAVDVFDEEVLVKFSPGFHHAVGHAVGEVVELVGEGLFVVGGLRGFAVETFNVFDEVGFELVLNSLEVDNHVAVAAVDEVGDAVEEPEGGRFAVGEHVAVALTEAFGDVGDAAVHGAVDGAVGVVDAEPEDAADFSGEPAAALSHETEAGLLSRGGAFVDVLLAVDFESHGTPAVGAGEGTGAHVFGHVHWGAFVVVAHEVHDFVDIDFVVGFNPEGHALGFGVAHGVLLIAAGFAVDTAEHGIDAGVAATDAAEGEGCVGVAEGEFFVFAVEPSAGTGVGDYIGGIYAFHFGLIDVVHVVAADNGVQTFAFGLAEFFAFHGELGDAGLVGVAADIAVGNAAGNPYSAVGVFIFELFGEVCLDGGTALSDEFENPNFVGVADGEAFAFAAIAIVGHHFGHPVDGFAGVLGALEGDVDEGAVVDAFDFVFPAFFAAAVGGFADGKLVFIHVADNAVGVGYLGDFEKFAATVPIDKHEHGTGGVVGSLAVVQLAIQHMAVGGIGNHGAAVLGGTFGEQEIGASRGMVAYRKDCNEEGERKCFFHNVIIYY